MDEVRISPVQRLVEGNAEHLTRFGYAPADATAPDWERTWQLLMSDFATAARPAVPSYERMTARSQLAARIYMRRRLLADRLFEECRSLYEELHAKGVDAELVETYALAREAYEDGVYQFGDARRVLAETLES